MKIKPIYLLLALTALSFWGCKKDKDRDMTSPSIQFLSPVLHDSGTILRDVPIKVSAHAFNGKSIKKVEFYVDDVMLPNSTDEAFPHEFNWQVAEKFGQPRVIKVVAYDSEDVTSSATITVRIFNGVEKAKMPTSRYAFTSNVVNGKIYVIGGGDGKAVEEYDPATNTWTPKAPCPNPHSFHSSCVINNTIYVFGGDGDTKVDAYDVVANVWTSKAPIPQDSGAPISLSSMAVLNGKAYLMGGLVNPEPARVVAYDPATDTWELTKSYKRNYSAEAVTVNGTIYFIGGCPFRSAGLCDNPSDSVWTFNPTTGIFTPKKNMHNRRVGHSATVHNNKIYVMGGTHFSQLSYKDMEVYDPATDTWTELPPLPEGLINFGCNSVNGNIYIIGPDRVYEYTPD